MLKLFYVTNIPEVAEIAEQAGVDRIFVDMEYIGKEERQPGMDTVKNRHTIDDVKSIRSVISKSDLLVRVNPVNPDSESEIESVISAGADYVMLPMWKNTDDVKTFLKYVNGRAKTMLLLETQNAADILDEVLKLDGIDEIHIGLNDLSISQGKKFLFEPLVDGTVDKIIDKIRPSGIPYGIGGFGRVGTDNLLPAERIIAEHYRLGSSMAIISRAFCDTSKVTDLNEIKEIFDNGIKANRKYEEYLKNMDDEYITKIHIENYDIVQKIVNR